ncbi:MAG: 30S ribosomal protein S20 [Planctomycetes bacterium]|nr:30S ribosomal protein S20 [Planctomycetota bacterium]
MPHNQQARKRVRQDEKRRIRNKARSSVMKTQIKKTRAAIETGDVAKSREALRTAMSKIDLAAKGGVIHKNTAGRRKSALSRQLLRLEKGKGAS